MRNIVNKFNILLIAVAISGIGIYVEAQVPRTAKVMTVGRNLFNYGNADIPKYDKQNSPQIVYSDQSSNQTYEDPYYQRKRAVVGIGTPFYIIGEKNGAYNVVEYEPDIIGRPGGIFGFLYSNHHFKDSKKAKNAGWIPKENVLFYDHSVLNTTNNLPVKYRVGVHAPEGLFNLNNSFDGNTVKVYSDPFLRNPLKTNVSNGDILYVYKYSKSGESVLVSDASALTGKNKSFIGWVSSDILTPVGQNEVRLIKNHEGSFIARPYDITEDSVLFSYPNIQSPLVFYNDGNQKVDAHTGNYNIPLSVWDRNSNKITNIKGGDIRLSEIRKMEKGILRTNIHLIFFIQQKDQIESFLNSFQNLYLKNLGLEQLTFSATAVRNKSGNLFYPSTNDFSQWMDFVKKCRPRGGAQTESVSGLSNAITVALDKTGAEPFQNNIIVIFGSNQQLSVSEQAYNALARHNTSLLFVQNERSGDQSSQDFLLEAKSIMDNHSGKWNEYISSYIVDNGFIKPELFRNIDTPDANLYLLDFPANSLSAGGIIFPKGRGTLSGKAFDEALDSVVSHTCRQDSMLLASLHKGEMKLGLLRSEPSEELQKLFTYTPDLKIDEIDRHNVSDTYFINITPVDSVCLEGEHGYLMDSEELEKLLSDYRALLPEFKDSIGKKELKLLRNIYSGHFNNINRAFRRDILDKKSPIALTFQYKTGIAPNDSLLWNNVSKKLKPKHLDMKSFNEQYRLLVDKMKTLETLYLRNRFRQIQVGSKMYFFIPNELIL